MIDLLTGKEIKEDNLSGNKKKDESALYKIKKIGPFDIINMMFTNKPMFDRLSDSILKQNFFMINRTFSIKYPLQAAMFNSLTINQAEVIRFWQVFLTAPSNEGYGRVPKFVYTKKAKMEDPDNLDPDTVRDYCKRYHLNKKDFSDMLHFYHDETIHDLNEFAKLTDKKELAKMFTSEKVKSEKKPASKKKTKDS